jgi:hypothetical protein
MRLQPDPELAVVEILRAALTEPVHTRLPDGVVYPALRVQAIGGTAVVRGYMDAALLQVSAHGPASSKGEIRDVIDRARLALETVDNAITSHAVVTDIRTTSPIWLNGDEPDLSSYVLTATVALHPLPNRIGALI